MGRDKHSDEPNSMGDGEQTHRNPQKTRQSTFCAKIQAHNTNFPCVGYAPVTISDNKTPESNEENGHDEGKGMEKGMPLGCTHSITITNTSAVVSSNLDQKHKQSHVLMKNSLLR